MTARLDKAAVLAQLTPEAVATTYGLEGRWSGRWLRSRRCPIAAHGSDAFGLSREGKWHCHGCDIGGGDLLSMIAACEGLDCSTDFPAVLEIAAAIAGVAPEDDRVGRLEIAVDDWGGTAAPLRAPKPRPAPPRAPLGQRVRDARARCEWVWSHLLPSGQVERTIETGRHWYLQTRGLPWRELARCPGGRRSIVGARTGRPGCGCSQSERRS